MPFDPKNQTWEGVFASFDEAAGDPAAFEGTVWLDKIAGRAQALLASSGGAAAVPPIAVTTEYALPFVAALAARLGQPLRVLDFGGGMATSYMPLRAMLPATQALDFIVIENAVIGERGREIFKDVTEVSFRTDLPSAPERFDIVHFGSSLHYVEDWRGVLKAALALQPEYFLVADLPAADNRTFVTTQNYYGRRIPVHFWNVDEFTREAEALGLTPLLRARYRGYYLGKDEELPTDNFDLQYRLTYTSQFIFRRRA
jgi:putative methyltransferase (TIGR04325 family)